MRILATTVICILALGLGTLCAEENAGKLHRVLDGYRKAYGGFRASEILKSVTLRGEQLQGDQNYEFLLRKKRPNSIRYSLSNRSNSVVCGYDGEVGWQRVDTGGVVTISDLEGIALESLIREAEFDAPLLRYFSRSGIRIRLLDTAVLEGRPTYQLEVVERGAPTAHYYLSMDAYQIVKKDLLNEEGEVVLETNYRNYREVDGIPFPFEIETKRNGKRISLTKVEQVEVNPGQFSFYFRKPTY